MSLIGYHHRQLPGKLATDTVNEDGYYCCCPIFHDDLTSDVVCNVYILNCDKIYSQDVCIELYINVLQLKFLDFSGTE